MTLTITVYAGASGDFNPIHLDDEFARSVELPGRDPARPVDDGAGRARAGRGRRRPAGAEVAERPVPRDGRAGEGHHDHLQAVRRDGEAVFDCEAVSRTATSSSARRRERAYALESDGVLTPRQALLLGKVVDGFAQTGQPVGSKTLAADPDVTAGPSTIRNELAVLEENGLLAHPHTSAGRIPTDAGYRYYVDRLLPAAPRATELGLSLVRREVDEAMRVTTETLSQVTNLLAIVTAPPIGDDDDPPHRGPAAAAAGADGRRDHLHRRGLEEGLHVRPPGRPRA